MFLLIHKGLTFTGYLLCARHILGLKNIFDLTSQTLDIIVLSFVGNRGYSEKFDDLSKALSRQQS